MPIKTDKPNLENFIRKTQTRKPEEVEGDFGQRGKRFLLRSPFGLWYELEADTPRDGVPVIKVSFFWDRGAGNSPYFSNVLGVVERFYDIQLGMVGALMEQARQMQTYWSGLFGSMTEFMKPFHAFQTGPGDRGTHNSVTQTGLPEFPSQPESSQAPSEETSRGVTNNAPLSSPPRSQKNKKSSRPR